MIAVDTNLLVYAHRQEAPQHDRALRLLRDLASSGRAWAVPWPCVHEFVVVVTQRIFTPSTTPLQAFAAIDAWNASQTLQLLGEAGDHFEVWRALVSSSGVTGSRIYDARIVAICIAHGVSELWSADRDFSRFPDLKIVNPLVLQA